jgi:hypothetical protein
VWLIPPPSWLERSRLAAYSLLAVAHLRDRGKTDAPAEQMADLDSWLAQVRRDFPSGGGDPLQERAAFNAAIEANFRDWGCSWSDGAWERMTPVFRELKRLADIHDFDLRIVGFPLRLQVEAEFDANEPQRRLARLAADLRVPMLDLLPPLRAAHQVAGAPPLFYDHCHPTPAGNELVAREILAFLRKEAS